MSIGAVVDHLAARATPEQRERVRRLRRASDDTPSPEREAARAEIALSVHGIHVDLWACPCGAPYAFPSSVCPSCRRDYPRKCLTSGCGNVNELEDAVTIGGIKHQSVRTYCAACSTDIGRKARAASFARSQIPPRERSCAMRLIAYEHQADALATLDAWVDRGHDSRTWRRDKTAVEASLGGTCAVYLAGRPGAGKSVLAAYAVYRAFVDCALVDSFRWYSQAGLSQLFAERYTGTDEQRAAAVNTWRAVTECPLLVIDDLFSGVPTPAFGEALATLMRERLDHMRPMVITSNIKPQWSVYFEHDVGRLESRWRGYGVEVVVSGVDLRAVTTCP